MSSGVTLCDDQLALSDTQIDSIQYRFKKIQFKRLFNSKPFQENSIQKIIQFKTVSRKFNSIDYSIQNRFEKIQFNRLFNSEGLKWPF